MSVEGTFPAYAVLEAGVKFAEIDLPLAPLGVDDVHIDVTHNGICHSDLHCCLNEWADHGMDIVKLGLLPCCPGHEAVGIISSVGSNVSNLKVGDRVGCGPVRSSKCFAENRTEICSYCQAGEDMYCDNGIVGLYPGFSGGFGKVIRIHNRYAFKIPDSIDSKYSPLLCAGVTTFTPLKKHPMPEGSTVAVLGLGGLGHMALQYAKAMGYRVTALTTSANKADLCKKYGAEDVIVTTDPEQVKKATNSFNMILNTASANIDLNMYLDMLKPQGKMIIMGIGSEPLSINPFSLLKSDKQVIGSQVGGCADMNDMLEFSAKHEIYPSVQVVEVPFGQNKIDVVNESVQQVIRNEPRFRLVMKYE